MDAVYAETKLLLALANRVCQTAYKNILKKHKINISIFEYIPYAGDVYPVLCIEKDKKVND